MKKVLIIGLLLMGLAGLSAQESKELDGVAYMVIEPYVFDFNAATGKVNIGERYVVDDTIYVVNGDRLRLNEIANCLLILTAPYKHEHGDMAVVTVYFEVVGRFGAMMEARVVKIVRN